MERKLRRKWSRDSQLHTLFQSIGSRRVPENLSNNRNPGLPGQPSLRLPQKGTTIGHSSTEQRNVNILTGLLYLSESVQAAPLLFNEVSSSRAPVRLSSLRWGKIQAETVGAVETAKSSLGSDPNYPFETIMSGCGHAHGAVAGLLKTFYNNNQIVIVAQNGYWKYVTAFGDSKAQAEADTMSACHALAYYPKGGQGEYCNVLASW